MHAASVHDDVSWVTANNPSTGPDDTSGGVGGIQPLGMTPSAPSGCRFIVWEVSQNANGPWLGARGGREGCSNWATYKVKIMKHVRFAPDKVVAVADGAANSTAVAVGRCAGRGTYYTRVQSSTGNSFDKGERRVLR